MKRMEISIWLKGITITAGLMGILFFFVYVPEIAREIKFENPDLSYMFWPCLSFVWLIAAGCYMVLILFWRVCSEIGKDNSFSKENANYFVWMSRITAVFSVIWFFGGVYLGMKQLLNPGIAILMLVGELIGITVVILTAALSRLVWKAYEMKQENELTI